MADKGWIKIYRQIQESAIWLSDEQFDYRSAWIDLIMMANIDNKTVLYRGQTISINRGDVYTSIRKLADRWHWSNGKVTRFIKVLVKLEMVKKKKTVKCATLLTLVKYEDFQSVRYTDRHSDKHTDRHSDGHTDGLLLKNNKNEKELKNNSSTILADMSAVEEEEEDVGMTDEEWDALEDYV